MKVPKSEDRIAVKIVKFIFTILHLVVVVVVVLLLLLLLQFQLAYLNNQIELRNKTLRADKYP